MLAPQLATMLVVLTTDAVADADDLDPALRAATRVTFDRLDSDGCMSTNDTVALLASGASGITPSLPRPHRGRHPRLHRPRHAAARRRRGRRPRDRHHRARARPPRTTPSRSAAASPAATCSRPRSSATTRTGAACSPRIGTTEAAFDPADLDVAMNGVWVCRRSTPAADPATVDLTAARGQRHRRPQVRRRTGRPSGPTTSPTPTSTRTARTPHDRRPQRPETRRRARQGRRPRRRPAVAQALPRQDRGGEVRRQRDDRRHPQARLRRGHRLPAVRRLQAGRRARRRPADLRDARPARHRVGVPRRPAGDHAARRWTSSGWCSSARSSASWSG